MKTRIEVRREGGVGGGVGKHPPIKLEIRERETERENYYEQ